MHGLELLLPLLLCLAMAGQTEALSPPLPANPEPVVAAPEREGWLQLAQALPPLPGGELCLRQKFSHRDPSLF